MGYPELIVMLTHNDRTVTNAAEIFEACKNAPAKHWGFKEVGIPPSEMKALYNAMKNAGKTTYLEIVAYTEEECFAGAQLAVDCGVDVLLGTMYFDSVHQLCKDNSLTYMPFVGKVTGRPSVLEGEIQEIIHEANQLLKKGVEGFDLLGYRYTGNAALLNKEFVAGVNAPICLAGSISSYQRLDEVKDAGSALFTIGGAFFENKFEGTFAEQIATVCKYMEK